MPPVADKVKERTGLTDMVARLLKERGLSFREFAKRVAKEKGTSLESEKSTIGRQMERYSAEDESFAAWSRVLDVPRSMFPPSPQPLTMPHLDLRLRRLEERIGTIEEGRTVQSLLAELAGGSGDIASDVRALQERVSTLEAQPSSGDSKSTGQGRSHRR